jgi:hypothetical protein
MRRLALLFCAIFASAGPLCAQPAPLPPPFQTAIDVNVINGGLSVTSSALPLGAATEATAAATRTAVSGLLTDTQLRASPLAVTGTFWQATQPVSLSALPALSAGTDTIGAVRQAGAWNVSITGTTAISATSLPLPDGAASAARQDTGNTSLAAINTKTPALGQAAMAASVPVAIASNQSAVPISVASLPLPSGAATEATLSALSAKHPATLGQKAMAASLAVVIANDQSAVPVSGTFWQATQPVSIASVPSHPVTNAGTFAVQAAATQSGTWTVQPGNTANTTAWNVSTQGLKSTYSASTGTTIAATATDFFTLTGSNTKTIRVTKVRVTGSSTAVASVAVLLAKRSTADTGGSAAAVPAVPYDSSSAAATATVLSYTANPTTGTLVGILEIANFTTGITANGTTTVPAIDYVWDSAARGQQPIILRGTGEVLALYLAGIATPAGAVYRGTVEWTEE